MSTQTAQKMVNVAVSERGGRPWDETLSIYSAFLGGVVVVGYFWLAPLWNPDYTPIRPWVWAVPGIICLAYYMFNVLCLFASARRTTEIGAMDTGVSFLVALAITLFVVGAWLFSKLELGGFQQVVMWES